MTLLVAPAPAPFEAIQIAAVPPVVDVLEIVRLAPPAFTPSMITLRVPFSLINAAAVVPDVPVMVAALPAAGLMVNVYIADEGFSSMLMGKVSPVAVV